MTWSAPGGTPASIAMAPSASAVSGVCDAGFSTTELPVASAGAVFQHAIRNGTFHGTMATTTPDGKPTSAASRRVSSTLALACSDGLTTIVFPAASAGASEYIVSNTGEFQGMMMPTTPSGSRSV